MNTGVEEDEMSIKEKDLPFNMDCKFCQDNINRVDYRTLNFWKYVTSV